MTVTDARHLLRPGGASRSVHLADLQPGDVAYLPSVRILEGQDEFGTRREITPRWHGPLTVRSVAEIPGGYAVNVVPCEASQGYELMTITGQSVYYGACMAPVDARPVKPKARRLSEYEAATIRELYAGGMKQSDIAEQYGVSRTAISYVVTGRSWRVKA